MKATPPHLIESISIPARDPGERRAFRKVGTRKAQSIAKMVVALAVVADPGLVRSVTAAAGSVADHTVLLPSLHAELAGAAPSPEVIEYAARVCATRDCSPIDDVRSTAVYRREVLRRVLATLLTRVLLERR